MSFRHAYAPAVERSYERAVVAERQRQDELRRTVEQEIAKVEQMREAEKFDWSRLTGIGSRAGGKVRARPKQRYKGSQGFLSRAQKIIGRPLNQLPENSIYHNLLLREDIPEDERIEQLNKIKAQIEGTPGKVHTVGKNICGFCQMFEETVRGFRVNPETGKVQGKSYVAGVGGPKIKYFDSDSGHALTPQEGERFEIYHTDPHWPIYFSLGQILGGNVEKATPEEFQRFLSEAEGDEIREALGEMRERIKSEGYDPEDLGGMVEAIERLGREPDEEGHVVPEDAIEEMRSDAAGYETAKILSQYIADNGGGDGMTYYPTHINSCGEIVNRGVVKGSQGLRALITSSERCSA